MPPTALLESIESVRMRARRLSVLYGVGVALAVALGLLVGVVALDWLLNLYAWPRVLLMVVSLAAFGWAVFRYVATPVAARITLSDIAGRLERAFPQFEDRLRSTINFAEGANPGSAVLQQRTIDQAVRLAGQINLADAVVAKPAVVSVSFAVGACVIVLLLAVGLMDRHMLGVIASRLVTPFSAQPWPKRVQIALDGALPDRVPVGQKIDVRMSLARGDKASLKPILYYQIDGGPTQQLFMSRGDGGAFGASLDARLDPGQTGGTMKVWIEAGDDRRDLPPVHIVPRLAIRQITAVVTPPAYAPKRPTPAQDLATAPVVAPEGAGVAVTIRFNKTLGGAPPTLEPVGDGPTTKPADASKWSTPQADTTVGVVAADRSRRFRVRAVDADGFANTALEEYELIVRPDTNLSIQLETPRKSEERTADSFVPLQATAEDDCGVDEVKLVVDRLSPSPKHWDLPLVTAAAAKEGVAWQPIDAAPDRVRNRLMTKWELADLKLTAGDVIEYALVARDNYDLNGRRHEPVATSKLRITIVSQDDLAARVTDELRSVKTQTGLLRLTEQRAKQETQQLADDTKAKPALDAGDQAVAQRLTQQQASAAAAAIQLGQRVQQALDRLDENRSKADDLHQTAEDVRDTLTKTGEGPMKEAAGAITDAAQKDKPAEPRAGDLKQAADAQQKALTQLDHALSKMESIGSLQASVAEINNILSEQKALRKANEEIAKTNLGKKPEEMKADDKAKLDAVADRQNKLADRTQKALDAMTKQAAQMQKSDPSSSDAMTAAAKQGEQAKVSPNQKRAAQQTGQNQQSNAQQTQQQVELGLEQMLGELKEAQKRELARLRDQMAQLQEQVATLIRRQSGHNLDSLLLQGPAVLKAADAKLVVTLSTDSKRKPDELKAPDARIATGGQELTARNARDLAGSTDSQPQAAAIGAQLGKAAGQMERAIVGLRGGKVAEAYDPHQVDALATLQDAKKQVDQQKDEADKKEKDQQKEAIRQRYEKIKAAQELVNADTRRVEKARDAAGNMRRTEWPTLAKLPGAQQQIADDTAKIEEDLKALGSIVYVWANRDIKHAMDGVHDQLVAAKTAVPTQAEQERVVEELAAMIKNLEEKPADQKFENAGGGGGGGGGGQQPPKMPSEVELKLLKSLQAAVNESTLKIAAAPKPDPVVLASLGGRQGELRNLLDNLLKKASQGKTELGAEPDNKDQLPEEAETDDVDQNDLEATLLGDDGAKQQTKVDKDFQLVGTRMARSRQRLAINTDPGRVTQEIQKRILTDLDGLIDLAHKNSQQQQASSSSKPGQPQGPPKPGDAQANNAGKNQGGKPDQPAKTAEGAVNRNSAGAGTQAHDLKNMTETASEWGGVSPRVRQAVIDSRGESIVEQYRKIIEDYYGALGNQNGKKR